MPMALPKYNVASARKYAKIRAAPIMLKFYQFFFFLIS